MIPMQNEVWQLVVVTKMQSLSFMLSLKQDK